MKENEMSEIAECECCKEEKFVQERPSMTAYVWDGKGDDPNRAGILCDECWEDYRSYWQERWNDYHSGLL